MDLGAGSGVLGIYTLLNKICKRVVFVNIDEDAVYTTKQNTEINNVNPYSIIALSDNIVLREGSMDILLPNPLYLPVYDTKQLDVATEGGIEGYETILYSIEISRHVLRNNGKLYLVYSSLSKPNAIHDYLVKQGFKLNKIKTKYFFEILFGVERVKLG